MLRFGAAALVGALLTPAVSYAGDGHVGPWTGLADRERSVDQFLRQAIDDGAFGVVSSVRIAGRSPVLDCVHATHVVRLDPVSGEASASLDLQLRANGQELDGVGIVFDEGLRVTAASADGRDVSLEDVSYSPTRITTLRFATPLPTGETTVIHLAYEGTLACGAFAASAGVVCTKGESFGYFPQQAVLPSFVDPRRPNETALDTMTRDIEIHVPANVDVVATGEHVDDIVRDGERVSRWVIDQPLSRTVGTYVLTGRLGHVTVRDRQVPTTLFFPAPGSTVDSRMAAWSVPVLDFLEGLAGPLPYKQSLTLVRLPATVRDPGTASFGMTLLSESYTRVGELLHEETWAHENSHLYWGITIPESNSHDSRLMSEGLATLTQLDYTWARHFANEDRDAYLARRFVPMALDLRNAGMVVPPIQLGLNDGDPSSMDSTRFMLWAYFRTAATLDHLRVSVGEESFRNALDDYARECRWIGCDPRDFQRMLERAAHTKLDAFFDRWVTANTRPEVTIDFTRDESGASATFTKTDSQPMTLEVWLGLEDGRRETQRVDLQGTSTTVQLPTTGRVRSVSLNPRHDVLVEVHSAVRGDLDFDGESDGLDLLACTRLLGRKYAGEPGSGLWNIDETFDPRCDRNGNLRIEQADLDELASNFGSLKPQ
ncbi:Aminopeptidase N [Labilithrix luteola]|uniref:Aminopeptidase N n=1 Tax=Labilithrix luteola TaxID=1391654 RepID=A0A0K1PVP1_9BACT|nr:Aminopeptidase N [Labilithrix luteola]